MTVYVDDMDAEYHPPHRPGMRYIMSHMIADTPEELHDMARRIGLNTKWFQRDHYDVSQSMKHTAIQYGAKPITWRQAGAMMRLQRYGQPMGDPATAQTRMLELRSSQLHKQHEVVK